MNKRILTVFLLALLLINSAACADTSDPAVTTQSAEPVSETEAAMETEIPKLPESVEQIDMNGFELSIKHHNQSTLNWAKNNLEVEEQDGDLFNDAIYDRNRAIEEIFNCKLAVESVDWINTGDVSKEVMAGDSTHDVWYVYDILILDCIEYLMPWENLVHVDLSQPWWNPMATDVFELGGNHYAAAGNFSVSVLSRASGFMFNKEIYNSLGFDKSLYDYVHDNEWTVDKMAEICIAGYGDINGNGMLDDNDRFGVNGSYKELYNRLLLGSGIQYVKKDDEGLPIFSLPTDEGAINKILHIIDIFSDRRGYASQEGSLPETNGLGSLNAGTLAGNYDITTDFGTLTVTNRPDDAKYEVTVTAASGSALYNGEEHSVSGFEGGSEDGSVAVTAGGQSYTVSGLSASASATDAGTYTSTVTGTPRVSDEDGNDVTGQFIVRFVNGSLSIGTRSVIMTSGSASKTYDGRPLRNDEVTVSGDGFAEGEGASYDV
jgi:hypothetical protein